MIGKMSKIWDIIEKEVLRIPSREGLFNQYKNRNPELDRRNAASIRRKNLWNYLDSFKRVPKILIVGEAPGFKGCRFSGVPFTSEWQLCNEIVPFSGKQSSTERKPRKERTATIFWKTIEELPLQSGDFFVWNSVPLHPHDPVIPLSNKKPEDEEIGEFVPLLKRIADILNPKKRIALGRKAENTFCIAGIKAEYIHHPANDIKGEFKIGMKRLFAD